MSHDNNYINKISVDKKIKPIPHSQRAKPELIIGNSYYLSLGGSEAIPCTLIQLIGERHVEVECSIKSRTQKGFILAEGTKSMYMKFNHQILRDEIGTTPEEAILNQVTA